MAYRPLNTGIFTVAAWVKITQPGAPLHVYVEGDGTAWRNRYTPSTDPTPRSEMLLTIAADDPAENVVYLARPCQYVSSDACDVSYWTNARFSPEIMDAMQSAARFFIRESGARQVTFTGYSGGGVVSAWLAAYNSETVAWTTVAGVVDDGAWTAYHNDSPLDGSVSIVSLKATLEKIPQTHYVGAKDDVVPPVLIQKWVASYGDASGSTVIIVPNATHTKGWSAQVIGVKK